LSLYDGSTGGGGTGDISTRVGVRQGNNQITNFGGPVLLAGGRGKRNINLGGVSGKGGGVSGGTGTAASLPMPLLLTVGAIAAVLFLR
jgi:hypothetical protein